MNKWYNELRVKNIHNAFFGENVYLNGELVENGQMLAGQRDLANVESSFLTKKVNFSQ